MKQLKHFIKSHKTGADAVKETTKKNVTAVKRLTYNGENKIETEYFSFKTRAVTSEELAESFPYCLGSNQVLIEIDANDY